MHLFDILKKRKILSDLQGKPYMFYRGCASFNPSILKDKCFFCSCFDEAKSFSSTGMVIEAEFAVKHPLIIDASCEGLFFYYDTIKIADCIIFPDSVKQDLLSFASNCKHSVYLSADEIGEYAKEKGSFDCVILKNVLEGNEPKFPVYDVIVIDPHIIRTYREVQDMNQDYDVFRNNTYKRVDLSGYILEQEQDKIAYVISKEGYKVERIIQKLENGWVIEDELVVITDKPIKIFERNVNNFITVKKEDEGYYSFTAGFTSQTVLNPNKGYVRVKNITHSNDYRIDIIFD